MTREQIEKIPEQINSGRLSRTEAVKKLAVFIAQNKSLYGLQKYDEDLQSEFFIAFLERAERSLDSFDVNQGTFFSYSFCLIRNICSSLVKKKTISNAIEHHNMCESITSYEERMQAYQQIKFEEFEKPKIPYRFKPISYKDFQIACKTDTYHIKEVQNKNLINIPPEIQEKLKAYSPRVVQNMVMVLALKSAFYITEEQINTISIWFNIDKVKLETIIQEIKDGMAERIAHKEIIEQRRNRAYFQHKKLKSQIDWNKDNKMNPEYINDSLNKKYVKNTKTWHILNYQMAKGKIHIRPTTKLIAQVLGISARQVTYYQTLARKIGLDLSKV